MKHIHWSDYQSKIPSFPDVGLYYQPDNQGYSFHNTSRYQSANTYSIHSNNSVKNYEFYSAIGYRIPIKKFDITPRFLFYYSDDSFYAHDGYGWYGGYAYSKNGKDNSWDSDYARKAKKLYPVDITTKAYNNFLGFRISFLPINQIKISAETYVSLFSKVQSYDCHHAAPDSKNDFSMTEIQEAKYRRFRETVSFTFILKNKYIIDLTSTYIFGGIIQGELYDDDELVTQKSGNDIHRLNINLGIGLKL